MYETISKDIRSNINVLREMIDVRDMTRLYIWSRVMSVILIMNIAHQNLIVHAEMYIVLISLFVLFLYFYLFLNLIAFLCKHRCYSDIIEINHLSYVRKIYI